MDATTYPVTRDELAEVEQIMLDQGERMDGLQAELNEIRADLDEILSDRAVLHQFADDLQAVAEAMTGACIRARRALEDRRGR